MEPMETMIQPKITGYRQLTQDEAELMNEIKALGSKIEGHIAMLQSHLRTQEADAAAAKFKGDDDPYARLNRAEAWRWISIGKTNLQLGLMALTRAVAQPDSF